MTSKTKLIHVKLDNSYYITYWLRAHEQLSTVTLGRLLL